MVSLPWPWWTESRGWSFWPWTPSARSPFGTFRGLSNYLYYFGGLLTIIIVKYGPLYPILIIKAPILWHLLRRAALCRRILSKRTHQAGPGRDTACAPELDPCFQGNSVAQNPTFQLLGRLYGSLIGKFELLPP